MEENVKKNEELEAARTRAALQDDENYKLFVEAYENNAEKVRTMSDYEFKKFMADLKAGRIQRMPWWKRAWHAITDDVDAAMGVWLLVTAVSAVGAGTYVAHVAKQSNKVELKRKKQKLEEDFNRDKMIEARKNVIADIRQDIECNGDNQAIVLDYNGYDNENDDIIAVNKTRYDQLVSDANLNINEIKSLVGATDIPSTDTYPKSDDLYID